MDREIVDRIKEEVDIVEVIGSYIPLKRAGSYYRALCPFHSEKTPSFYVHPHKKIFHCFGCGASGDVITFLMKYRGLSFYDALRELGSSIGLNLDERAYDNNSKIYEINEKASYFYKKLLIQNPPEEVRDFLNDRGIDETSIEHFNLGYAPGFDALYSFLKSSGYSDDEMIKAGLVNANETRIMDFFIKRFIFPIRNYRGKISGFGGRVLGEGEPKYLNIRETPVFKKHTLLYNMESIREEEDNIILVEGYMDVISLHRAGFRRVIAPLGTSFSVYHARFIRKYSDKIFICFDGDEPGSKAVKRTIPVLLRQGVFPYCVSLPEGEDPDSFIRRYGKDEFRNLLEKSMDFIMWSLKRDESKDTIKELAEWISYIPDGFDREEWMGKLSQITGFSREVLQDMRKDREIKKEIKYDDEILLLSFVLQNENFASRVKNSIPLDYFKNEKVRKIMEGIFQGEDGWVLLENTEDQILRSGVGRGAFMGDISSDLDEVIARFKIKREKEIIKSKIEEMEKLGNVERVVELLRRMQELKKQEEYYGKKKNMER